jgi:hypothetical protein
MMSPCMGRFAHRKRVYTSPEHQSNHVTLWSGLHWCTWTRRPSKSPRPGMAPRSAWERSSSGLHTGDPDAYRMGASRGSSTNPPFGQTGENSPSGDKLCLGGGPHADGACHCCSCVHRVRIDRGRTRLVRVPAADGQRTSSVTSGGQLARISHTIFAHSGSFARRFVSFFRDVWLVASKDASRSWDFSSAAVQRTI